MSRRKRATRSQQVESYKHPQAESPMRPDVGTQALFRKKKSPQKYAYDDSLAPALEWDGQNPAREQGEAAIEEIRRALAELQAETREDSINVADGSEAASLARIEEAAERLKALSRPFLNWAGKAERTSFEVPTLPLFVHERLSTEDIIETVKGHQRNRQQILGGFYDQPQHSVTSQVTRAYEYLDRWTNRMILGDSLVVMNSLLRYENLGGQVQMIYVDPPYGVKFGSNFQPFARRRDVKHNDEGMTREPEMVQAYRDTWELGLHSYLTYLRDRLLLARELLTESGSIFVQISDENLHHVREVMDEVFGAENFIAVITFQTATNQNTKTIQRLHDYLLWYGKTETPKVNRLFRKRTQEEVESTFNNIDEQTGERYKAAQLKENWTGEIVERLREAGRLTSGGAYAKRYESDFEYTELHNVWSDTVISTFSKEKLYVVQTNRLTIERCMLMTTDPGDLVLDPTCGSGTTAYVAEQWGRRWITIDTSRVPLALARQRLLTATFPYYELQDEALGPAGGFVYKRRQNKKGEEVGGIVPHITLRSIANDEPPDEEVLVNRPEEAKGIVRVTGTFAVEATIPTPVDWEGDGVEDSGAETAQEYGSFVERMLEVLRRSPVLHLDGNRTVTFRNVRRPARTLSLSAEALVDATAPGQSPNVADAVDEALERDGARLPLSSKPVAFAFGPENGAVSEKLVFEAAREAHAKNYTHLYVVGFAIEPNARELVEKCAEVVGLPATCVQATPDLLMGDLLKNMRSSQIFSVAGLPEIKIHARQEKGATKYQVELLGLDVFDPVTMEVDHRRGNDVPAWFLDTDYNGLCFLVSQAFFPRTSAWDNLKKALRGDYDEVVWDHLAGSLSAPFEAGEHKQVAVKVIDDRGNELLVVKSLQDATR
jgi:adenine-specific DNA-methyltransferase